jgi:hypothetical protein
VRVAGRFHAVITNTTFSKFDGEFNPTDMALPKKKAARGGITF